MALENFTQLPSVGSAMNSDIIAAVQGGVTGDTVQLTLSQVLSLALTTNTLSNAGNPNGVVAGNILQLCLDTTNKDLYICTTTGSISTAVWTLIGNNLTLPAQGGTGVASPTAHTLPVAEGSSNFTFLGPLTNGQLLIGSTGLDPAIASLTAGANISITPGAGSIAIAATGAASFTQVEVTGTTQAMAINTTYVANNAALVTLTLPVTAVFGSRIEIIGKGAGGWKIAQGASQQIHIGSNATTAGATGYAQSTNQFDSLVLMCTTANNIWTSVGGPQGIITVA